MQNVVLTIHLILILLLIGAILVQRSEGGALGIGGGGNVMSGRGAATALQKATWALAAAFIVTSLTLTVLAVQESSDRGLLEGADGPTAPIGVDGLGGGELNLDDLIQGADEILREEGAIDDAPVEDAGDDALDLDMDDGAQ